MLLARDWPDVFWTRLAWLEVDPAAAAAEPTPARSSSMSVGDFAGMFGRH